MEKTAREVIASGDPTFVVDFAIEANRLATRVGKELNEAKTYLREVGRDRAAQSGDRTAELEGNLGVASVVFERDQTKTLKGVDLKNIEQNLSAETFATLFTKKVVVEPSKDILEKLSGLTPAERAVIDQFLETRPTTPKVYLPK